MTDVSQPVRVVRDLRIPMPDGVELAANLYLPEGAGPVPAILQYTPYLKDGHGGRGQIEVGQRYFAGRGYACLDLDMRGFGASGGVPAPPFSPSEWHDGHAALAWIAAQPWCDGRTGIWGVSYGGDTALSVAATAPPSLGAIVPIHATDDEFTGFLYPHGCRGSLWSGIDWGLRMVGVGLLPPLAVDPADPAARERTARLWRDRLDVFEPWPLTWHTIPPETWLSWRVDVAAIRAATYAVSAWHDMYPGETLRYFNAISAPKRVLIGPWKHEHPDVAVRHPIGFLSELVRWWDRWLKGVENGIMDEPPTAFWHEPGGWRSAAGWPPAGARVEEHWFGAGHELVAADVPVRIPTGGSGPDTYRVDPTVGLAHLPWDWTAPASPVALDISPDDHRALTYTTPPLGRDLEIAGDPELVVYLESNQPDFPLAAWLSDVAPNGRSTLICQGWVRPAFLAGGPLEPGRVYELRVPLNPTLYRVPAGHRLRAVLAGSDFPKLMPARTNPVLTIHRTERYPSRLRLPVAAGQTPAQTPHFAPALAQRPAALLESRSPDEIARDLLDRHGVYRRRRYNVFQLDAGTRLTQDLTGEATMPVASPGEAFSHGTYTISVERPFDPVVVRTELHETLDSLRISANITLDGRPHYAKSWEIDLRRAGWSLEP